MANGKRTASRVVFAALALVIVAAAVATVVFARGLGDAWEHRDDVAGDVVDEQVEGGEGSGTDVGGGSGASDVPAGAEGTDGGLYHAQPSSDHVVVDDETGLRFVDNELVVYAASGASEEDIAQLVAERGGQIVGRIDVVDAYQVRFDDARTLAELDDLASDLKHSNLVDEAFSNLVTEWGANAETTDPAWKSADETWGYDAIHLAEAWDDVSASPDVTVGVYDNQFFGHEDLSFAALSNDAYDASAGGEPSHGTHVAGTIAALANTSGSVGVATGCALAGYAWKSPVEDEGWDPSSVDTFAFNYGLTYLIDRQQARVVNISAGITDGRGAWLAYCASRGNSEALDAMRRYADRTQVFLSRMLRTHDFLICKAAGNDNSDSYLRIDEPVTVDGHTYRWGYVPNSDDNRSAVKSSGVAYEVDDAKGTEAQCDFMGAITDSTVRNHIVVVGAAARGKRGGYCVAYYSNRGSRVDLVAPGSDVYSSIEEGGQSGYGYMDGTSMATPMVSGAAALVYSADPTLTGDQVKDILVSTANGEYEYEDDGFNDRYSMLDVAAAANEAHSRADFDGDPRDQHERDIVLVLDTSDSMSGTPLDEVKQAAKSFASTVFGNDARVSIVTFDSRATRRIGYTTSQENLDAAVDDMSARASTNMYDGLRHADLLLSSSPADKRIIVLMTDGEPNEGLVGDDLVSYADVVKSTGTLVYTLGFFSSLGDASKAEAQQLLERIASDGCHYEISDASDLQFFFGDIADQINGVKYNYIRIACPVDVSVTYDGETLSSEGNDKATRASFGTLTFEQAGAKAAQDAGGEDGSDADDGDGAGAPGADLVKVLRLREGPAYDVQIRGTGRGTMDYTIGFVDDEGTYSDLRYFNDIAIGSRTEIATTAEHADVTQLDVDEDGDGAIDLKYRAGRNQHAVLLDNTPIARAAMPFAAAVAVLVIGLVAFIWFALVGRRLLQGSRR